MGVKNLPENAVADVIRASCSLRVDAGEALERFKHKEERCTASERARNLRKLGRRRFRSKGMKVQFVRAESMAGTVWIIGASTEKRIKKMTMAFNGVVRGCKTR